MTAVLPKVSVVLPVYNGGEELPRAVRGILGQTFGDFELIVVDDGSTDGTPAYLRSIADPRLRVVRGAHAGITAALRLGLDHATGEYVARQDADDISHPARLALQVEFLDANPDFALVGAWAIMRDAEGTCVQVLRHPTSAVAARWFLLFDNAFVHSLAMFRRDAAQAVGGYAIAGAEDYDLWAKINRLHKVGNLPIYLLLYRLTSSGLHAVNAARIQETAMAISAGNVAHTLAGSAWQAQAGNVARLKHLPETLTGSQMVTACTALLKIRERYLAGWPVQSGGQTPEQFTWADERYISIVCWRLIAEGAIVRATPGEVTAVWRLWRLSRQCGTASWRSWSLAAMLVIAMALGPGNSRLRRSAAGRVARWPASPMPDFRDRILPLPAGSEFGKALRQSGVASRPSRRQYFSESTRI